MNLIYKLKEFYILEMFQVAMYNSQMDALQDEYVKYAYERMVELERQHVDFFKEMLHKYNEDTPSIPGNLTAFAGSILGGVLLDFTTDESRYKLGIAVEAKAMEMYSEFIKMSREKHPDLCKRLWLNKVDEEFHLLWYKDNLNKAKSQGNSA